MNRNILWFSRGRNDQGSRNRLELLPTYGKILRRKCERVKGRFRACSCYFLCDRSTLCQSALAGFDERKKRPNPRSRGASQRWNARNRRLGEEKNNAIRLRFGLLAWVGSLKPEPAKPTAACVANRSGDCGFDQPAASLKIAIHSTVETVLVGEGPTEVAGFRFRKLSCPFLSRKKWDKAFLLVTLFGCKEGRVVPLPFFFFGFLNRAYLETQKRDSSKEKCRQHGALLLLSSRGRK